MSGNIAGSKSADSRHLNEIAILKDPLAKEAFEELTIRRNVNGERLLSLLVRIPLASDKPLKLVDKMQDRQVRALPGRIRRWADLIERVNESPRLTPNLLTKLGGKARNPRVFPAPLDSILALDLAQPTADLLNDLPKSLRIYSDQLQARLDFFHPTGPRRIELGYPRKSLSVQKWLTLDLLSMVRLATQEHCYDQIAKLLGRAYELVESLQLVSQEGLAKLESDNPWPTWVLYEANLKLAQKNSDKKILDPS